MSLKNAGKKFLKSYINKKTNRLKKKIIKMIIPLLLPIFAIIIVLVAIQGFMNDNIIDDTVNAKNNGSLNSYIKNQVNITNNKNTFDSNGNVIGKLCDYYGTDKNIAMKPGIVSAYMKYDVMAKGNNDMTGSEKDKITADEQKVDEILEKLKPNYQYMIDSVHTERHYIETVHDFDKRGGLPEGIKNTYLLATQPKDFSSDTYKIGDNIYILDEDVTYTVVNKTDEEPTGFKIKLGKPNGLKNVIIYATKPQKFNANSFDPKQVIYIIDEDNTYTCKLVNVPKVEKKDQQEYFLTKATTYKGNFKVTYKKQTTKYKNKKGEEVDETKPVMTDFKQTDNYYDPLRNAILKDYPKEDINEAITFIANLTNDVDTNSTDMDWIMGKVDDTTYSGGGSFLGPGEDFNGSHADFIKKIAPGAIKTYQEYKVFPSISIAQAIQESGWGTTGLAKKGNNLFGIKADSSWHGPYVQMLTTEYDKNNNPYYIIANFRAYDTWDDSIEDHGKFLSVNSIYRCHGFFNATDYAGQAQALQSAGYATDPAYAQKLINIIKIYSLYQYDTQN